MTGWLVVEALIAGMLIVHTLLYIRARTRPMTGLRRQQFLTGFVGCAMYLTFGALHLLLHVYP